MMTMARPHPTGQKLSALRVLRGEKIPFSVCSEDSVVKMFVKMFV